MKVLAWLTLLAWVGACTVVPSADDAGTLESQTGALAVFSLEREQSLDPSMTATPAEIGAAFARYHQVDGRAVLALLGQPEVPLDSCLVDPTTPTVEALSDPFAAVELLDAGVLEVSFVRSAEATEEGPGPGASALADQARALPRTFPELGGVVRGAFYAEVTHLPPARAERDEYAIHLRGSPEVPEIVTTVSSPPGFADVWLNEERLAGEPLRVRRGQEFVFTWDAADPEDRVDLSLVSGGVEVRCVVADQGELRVPGAVTSELAPDESARLLLRRVRREPLRLESFEVSWASVATARGERLSLD